MFLLAHIATVGKAMSSPEEIAYPILRKHDVDYVLVIFGGLTGYSGDDINKFLWMVRIAQGVWPNEIREADYFTPQGQYKIDDGASPTMKNSLMFKMSYYRFNELFGGKPGMDRVRGTPAVSIPPTLDVLDDLEEIKVAVKYLINDKEIAGFPGQCSCHCPTEVV